MRKKLIAAAALSLALTGIFTACGDGKDIGQSAAKEAAFTDAGVQESDTSRLKVTKERDDGRTIYEIDFDVAEKEYSYDIDASNGEIISSDVEINENYQSQQSTSTTTTPQADDSAQSGTAADGAAAPADDGSGTTAAPAANNSGTAQTTTTNAAVSIEDAKSTALAKVPGATDEDIRIELDNDDGKTCYEGEIIYNHMEYEFKIDASNGNIIEWSEETW